MGQMELTYLNRALKTSSRLHNKTRGQFSNCTSLLDLLSILKRLDLERSLLKEDLLDAA